MKKKAKAKIQKHRIKARRTARVSRFHEETLMIQRYLKKYKDENGDFKRFDFSSVAHLDNLPEDDMRRTLKAQIEAGFDMLPVMSLRTIYQYYKQCEDFINNMSDKKFSELTAAFKERENQHIKIVNDVFDGIAEAKNDKVREQICMVKTQSQVDQFHLTKEFYSTDMLSKLVQLILLREGGRELYETIVDASAVNPLGHILHLKLVSDNEKAAKEAYDLPSEGTDVTKLVKPRMAATEYLAGQRFALNMLFINTIFYDLAMSVDMQKRYQDLEVYINTTLNLAVNSMNINTVIPFFRDYMIERFEIKDGVETDRLADNEFPYYSQYYMDLIDAELTKYLPVNKETDVEELQDEADVETAEVEELQEEVDTAVESA